MPLFGNLPMSSAEELICVVNVAFCDDDPWWDAGALPAAADPSAQR